MNERWMSRLSLLIFVVGMVWLIERIVPVLQRFGDILLMFFVAWLVAFILDPVAVRLIRLGLPRGVAAIIIYLALLIVLVLVGILVGPVIIEQIIQLLESLPQLITFLPSEAELADFLGRFGLSVPDLAIIYQPDLMAQRLQEFAGAVLQGILTIATSIVTVIIFLLLSLVISFYMLLEGHRMVWGMMRIVPAQYRREVLIFLEQLSSSFGGFLRGQIIQAMIFGAVVVVVMAALRLRFVAISAVTSAILMLIPLLGPTLALIPPMVVAAFESTAVLITISVVLIIVQSILINVAMPRILSTQIGMPALLVFLAILVGLRVGGPLGAFFGIPIMGVIYGTTKVIFKRWRASQFAKRQQQVATISEQNHHDNASF